MASFSETSALVLKGVQACKGNADCYAVSEASGVDLTKTRVSLHSLLINELVEVKTVVRRKKTNGMFTEFNVYGLTGKGVAKLADIANPKPKPEKKPKPKPVEKPEPKKEPVQVKHTVCKSAVYEVYRPTPSFARNYVPSPIRGCN